jgi:2-polyprenyl-3-methyl-5-hydroxy-6-metoxy-1,4-benzoquinol methylase
MSAPPGVTHALIDPAHELLARTKARMVNRVAQECAARGWRRVALFGAGRHTRLFIRQPWGWHGVRIVGVIDDAPTADRIAGVPVVRPEDFTEHVDAVVVSSDTYEGAIAARAAEVFGPRAVPVVRIYGEEPAWEPDEAAVRRLTQLHAVSDRDARWLVANRRERHDATLPVLPPARTELHLRRYDLAATLARGRRVLDAACGTGYGASLLRAQGAAASVLGIDIDPDTIDYARRRFGAPGVEFRIASAASTGLADASVDLVTSFETIEHMEDPETLLAEFVRVLRPGGTLVLSTPNDWGLTEFHAHSFTPDQFRRLAEKHVRCETWLGQRAGDVPALDAYPAGIFPVDEDAGDAETLLVIARKP